MVAEYWNYVVRKPRHTGTGAGGWHVQLVCVGSNQSHAVEATLMDCSRSGAQLTAAMALGENEPVIVRFVDERFEVKHEAVGVVRWRQANDESTWRLGIRFDEELDLATLGELFLHEMLDQAAGGE